jgi:hypothetical protein
MTTLSAERPLQARWPLLFERVVLPGRRLPIPFEVRGPATSAARFWGKVLDKKLVYSVEIYQGHNWQLGASNQNQDPLFAARVAYNFWDPEQAPAYYTSSTYYGKADILTVALAAYVIYGGQ